LLPVTQKPPQNLRGLLLFAKMKYTLFIFLMLLL